MILTFKSVSYICVRMVKHVHIALDDKDFNKLEKYKQKYSLTWASLLKKGIFE